jgi:hypothetical protein
VLLFVIFASFVFTTCSRGQDKPRGSVKELKLSEQKPTKATTNLHSQLTPVHINCVVRQARGDATREMSQEHQTEAACLLDHGASYRSRVGLVPASGDGEIVFAGLKEAAMSLFVGDAPIYHFDLEGRWQRAFVDETHYLKGLDGTVKAIDRIREPTGLRLWRRSLAHEEAARLDTVVQEAAAGLAADLDAGRLARREPPAGSSQPLETNRLRVLLERIVAWDPEAWRAHRIRYDAAYGPIAFLPPECQGAVVLQATLGNLGGRSFGMGPVAEPKIRSIPEFEDHIRAVTALLGRRLRQSRAIFLCGSGLWRLSQSDVHAYLEAVGRAFRIQKRQQGEPPTPAADRAPIVFDGIHVFLDDFRNPRPDRTGWCSFAERGIVRASLGVESGDRHVRAQFRSEWEDDELRAVVTDLKAAGIGISVLVLVGAGGAQRADDHLGRTAGLIASLALGAGDFVFLLDENEVRDPEARPEGVSLLGRADWIEAQRKLKGALSSLNRRGIKVLPYTMEKQWM